MHLRPISEAPTDGRPIIGYFPDRDERHTFAVVYFDEGSHIFYLAYGRRFIGQPTKYCELSEFLE